MFLKQINIFVRTDYCTSFETFQKYMANIFKLMCFMFLISVGMRFSLIFGLTLYPISERSFMNNIHFWKSKVKHVVFNYLIKYYYLIKFISN